MHKGVRRVSHINCCLFAADSIHLVRIVARRAISMNIILGCRVWLWKNDCIRQWENSFQRETRGKYGYSPDSSPSYPSLLHFLVDAIVSQLTLARAPDTFTFRSSGTSENGAGNSIFRLAKNKGNIKLLCINSPKRMIAPSNFYVDRDIFTMYQTLSGKKGKNNLVRLVSASLIPIMLWCLNMSGKSRKEFSRDTSPDIDWYAKALQLQLGSGRKNVFYANTLESPIKKLLLLTQRVIDCFIIYYYLGTWLQMWLT